MLPTLQLMNSESPLETTGGDTSWTNGNNEGKTEAFTPLLDQIFLIVINKKTSDAVQKKHNKK